MTTQEVANRLVELINAGDDDTAHKELYHEDVISIENPVKKGQGMEYMEIKGMTAKKEKTKQWNEMTEELHGYGAGEPMVVENAFVVKIWIDSKMKGYDREKMDELAVYSVVGGKIVREEFVY